MLIISLDPRSLSADHDADADEVDRPTVFYIFFIFYLDLCLHPNDFRSQVHILGLCKYVIRC